MRIRRSIMYGLKGFVYVIDSIKIDLTSRRIAVSKH